ncbi:MAG: outer rane biosis protein BamB [Verrucomicrobiales bacterium]|nr:outer rane biosis protein BamB [Verrucomicrobiales bacterium]
MISVALNKKTGEVLWKCPLPEADAAAFASVIIVETAGVKQYVQLLEKGLVGVDAKTGKFLWRYTKAVSKYGANIPTPVGSDNYIYAGSAGTGGGVVKLTATDGKIQAEEVYFESKLPTAIGGALKVGNFLYGTTGQALLCIDFATGTVKWEDRAIGAASLCFADGHLYLHGENGAVALVEASPETYREEGRFTPVNLPSRSNGMEKLCSRHDYFAQASATDSSQSRALLQSGKSLPALTEADESEVAKALRCVRARRK